MDKQRILITPGEPAGIGPDITIKIAQESWPAELIAVCDPELLIARAYTLKLPLVLKEWQENHITPHQPGILHVVPVKLKEFVEPGKLNPVNSHYVLQTLETATKLCLEKKAHALVTGPVHKSIMNEAGIKFTGHTEFLAQYCEANDVIMLFVADQLKVALVTTHIPLSQVPHAVTKEKLIATLHLLSSELKKRFGLPEPRILVCGLNPHAGEMGYLGREEIDVIEPALQECRKINKNIQGPFPADTIFTEKYLNIADCILAMYHDQALPVVKHLGFGHAVNVTLGLPIIRTSVDHGTALDLAGTDRSDPGSLSAALRLAIQLS